MWAVIILSAVPLSDGIIRDRVDVLEIQHVYSDCGKKTFVQVIGWEVDSRTHREVVAFWRMMKPKEPPPIKRGSAWLFQWDERTEDAAGSYRVSHSQTDYELENRNIVPVDRRRGLKNSGCKNARP